jgi:diguanylate cyclase (GGDEF)-like protein
MPSADSISFLSRLKPAISLRQLRPLLVLGLLGVSFWNFSPVRRFDAIWADVLLTSQAQPTSDRLLVLSITPDDVIANGIERLSRKYLAEKLNQLADGGVERVLLDFNLGGGLTSEEETALSQAMSKLGPKRLGLAYELDPTNRTAPTLLKHAQTVNLGLSSDFDGRMRAITARQGIAPNACEWLAHGKVAEIGTLMDLRFDSRQIRHISLAEVEAGVLSGDELRDKLVIISFDRRVTRSRIYLPVVGESDRGTVLALGTAAALANYTRESEKLAPVPMILYVVSLVGGFLIGLHAPRLSRAGAAVVGLAALNFFFALQLTLALGIPSRPFSTVFVAIVALKVALAHRLRVTELFLGLMSGVLSPEEVWLWRIYGDRATPALLFDALGRLKKANSAAMEQLKLHGAVNHRLTPPIAQQLMPVLGERASLITTHFGSRQVWEVEWPSANLPLATLSDVTRAHEERQHLQRQLHTDLLTGALNRSGFEAQLQAQVDLGQGAYAVYFLDMNGFKSVNDQYGHAAGDQLLKIATDRFREILRPTDALARFGGDEFAILVERELTCEQAEEFRARIESTLSDPIALGEMTVRVGVAAGFALPWSGNEAGSAVMERADLEMYRRKAALKSAIKEQTEAGQEVHVLGRSGKSKEIRADEPFGDTFPPSF